MGYNKIDRIVFNCDMCGKESNTRPSQYKRKIRHFCSMFCYSNYRKERLPKEEHNRYGKGFTKIEREKRKKARSILNHHLRDKKIKRPCCEVCQSKAEAHHEDYDKPLDVRWLCFNHHREYHKNPDLLK